MVPNSPADDTQSIQPASDPRELARQNLQRLNVAVAKPERIGPYKILETLGEGGMGIVYLAEQSKPIHRRVALKIIKLGMDTKQVIARFETEREALALMNHPNVAKVFDAGATETGRPYFAMEYVQGIPITEYCDKHRLNTEERLRLFMDVCNAIQHAHQKGIIHRDIKPSNVLVSVDQTAPPLDKGGLGGVAVKVIDFGIAKATQQKLSVQTLFTETGQFIGTPAYMSPEQAGAAPADIDTRTDVYSLGVLLYELLCGARPFDDLMLRSAALSEIQRIIREVEPPKPSTKLSAMKSEPGAQATGLLDTVASHRSTQPSTLLRQLRGDLDWIVMRAMEKDRTRRYDTANGLAMEIQRYLSNEPVLAGPPSGSYRIKKFVVRNKGPVAAISAVVLALTLGFIGSTVMYVRAVSERNRADAETKHAEREAATSKQVSDYLVGLFSASESRGNTITARELLDRGAQAIQEELSEQPAIQSKLMETIGNAYARLGQYDSAMRLLRAALELRRSTFGPTSAEVAESLTSLGDFAYFSKNDNRQAAEWYRQSLAIRLIVLGDTHKSTCLNRFWLANALKKIGDLPEAESLLRDEFTAWLKPRDPDDAEQNNGYRGSFGLADFLEKTGRGDEAVRVVQQAVETLRGQGSNRERDLAQELNWLAYFFTLQGQYSAAEDSDRDALDLLRRRGAKSDELSAALEVLGNHLTEQGKFEEAAVVLHEALSLIEITQGQPPWKGRSQQPGLTSFLEATNVDNSDWISLKIYVLLDLAGVMRAIGSDEESRSLLLQAASTSRKELENLKSQPNNLTRELVEAGEYGVAEQLLTEELATRRSSLGDKHTDISSILYMLSPLLERRGDYAGAEKLYRDQVTILHEAGRDGALYTNFAIDGLVRVLRAQNNSSEARVVATQYMERVKLLASQTGVTSAQLDEAASGLLKLQSAELREPAAALPLAEKAVEISAGREPDILDTLALAYQMNGDVGKAVQIELRAFHQLSSNLSPSRLNLRGVIEENLIAFLRENGDYVALASVLQEMEQFYRDFLQRRRAGGALNDIYTTNGLIQLGYTLNERKHYVEADSVLREGLKIREKTMGPYHWRTGSACILLGASLTGQNRFDEAEPLLLHGYEIVQADPYESQSFKQPKQLALQRITMLYDSWDTAEPGKGYAEKAAQWRAKFDEMSKSQNAETPK